MTGIIYPTQIKTDWVNDDGTIVARTGTREINYVAFEIVDQDGNKDVEIIEGSFGGNEAEWKTKVMQACDVFVPWENKQLNDARRLHRKGLYAAMILRFGTDNLKEIEARFAKNLRYKPREYQLQQDNKIVLRLSHQSDHALRFASGDGIAP